MSPAYLGHRLVAVPSSYVEGSRGGPGSRLVLTAPCQCGEEVRVSAVLAETALRDPYRWTEALTRLAEAFRDRWEDHVGG